jgi:hypothetical protein
MILGRGTAQTDNEIIAEYHLLLSDNHQQENLEIIQRLRGGPGVMRSRIGKPIAQWSDEDILKLYADRNDSTGSIYSYFLTFLFFRGYRRASLNLLIQLPTDLSRHFVFDKLKTDHLS